MGRKAFIIGVGEYYFKENESSFRGDCDGAKLDSTAILLDDYMNAPALIAAYADPKNHQNDGTTPDVSNLTATLKRAFPAGKKQTVCLPFPPEELLKYGTVWSFMGFSGGKAVMEQRISGLKANTPYVFEPTNDLLNITFPSVGISIGSDPKTEDDTAGFTFRGTYGQIHWQDTSDEVTQGRNYSFMADDSEGQTTSRFVRVSSETSMRPFSCWLEYSGVIDDTKTLPDVIEIEWMSIPGGSTGIETVDSAKSKGQSDDAWYTLSGTRLGKRPTAKGLYIVNGSKVVIK